MKKFFIYNNLLLTCFLFCFFASNVQAMQGDSERKEKNYRGNLKFSESDIEKVKQHLLDRESDGFERANSTFVKELYNEMNRKYNNKYNKHQQNRLLSLARKAMVEENSKEIAKQQYQPREVVLTKREIQYVKDHLLARREEGYKYPKRGFRKDMEKMFKRNHGIPLTRGYKDKWMKTARKRLDKLAKKTK